MELWRQAHVPSLAEELFDRVCERGSQFSSVTPPPRRSTTLQGRSLSRVVGPHKQDSVERRKSKENSQLSSGKMGVDMEGVGERGWI